MRDITITLDDKDAPDASLDNLAIGLERLKREILCEIEPLGCMSSQHYYLVLAALDTAVAQARIACYYVRRGD